MRLMPILAVLGSAALVGWMTPDLAETSAMIGESNDAAKDAARLNALSLDAGAGSRQSVREAWLSGETVLDRQDDGHFYANVLVDSRDYRFLVDTGASMVALTGADADAMGLTWSDSDLRQIGRGASGPVYGVPVTLDRLELGGFEARNVQAAIVPEGLDISLLGQSFLSQLRGVRIEGDRMLLGGL